jgi:hypothetical protein
MLRAIWNGRLRAAVMLLTLGCSSQEFSSDGAAGAGASGGAAGAVGAADARRSDDGGIGLAGEVSPTDPSNCGVTIQALASAPAPCTFTLEVAPPVPSNVLLRAGDISIPMNDTDGWMYGSDPQTIVLTGSYCQAALAGTISNLTMLFGCGTHVIP